MSEKKYLDYDGLAAVAGQIKERVKAVSQMPATASNHAVVLYTGLDTENYISGHIYIANTFPIYAWKDNEDHVIYTESETPSEGDTLYATSDGAPASAEHLPSAVPFNVSSYDSSTSTVTDSDGYEYTRNPSLDYQITLWFDLSTSLAGIKPVENIPLEAEPGTAYLYVGSGTSHEYGHIYYCDGTERYYAWGYEFRPDEWGYDYTLSPTPQVGDTTVYGGEITAVAPDYSTITINGRYWMRFSNRDYDNARWVDVTPIEIPTFDLINTGTAVEPVFDWIQICQNIKDADFHSRVPITFFKLYGRGYGSGTSYYSLSYFGNFSRKHNGATGPDDSLIEEFTIYAGTKLVVVHYDMSDRTWSYEESNIGSDDEVAAGALALATEAFEKMDSIPVSQCASLPNPNSVPLGTIYQYVGPTTESFIHGYFYQTVDVYHEGTQWLSCDVQAGTDLSNVLQFAEQFDPSAYENSPDVVFDPGTNSLWKKVMVMHIPELPSGYSVSIVDSIHENPEEFEFDEGSLLASYGCTYIGKVVYWDAENNELTVSVPTLYGAAEQTVSFTPDTSSVGYKYILVGYTTPVTEHMAHLDPSNYSIRGDDFVFTAGTDYNNGSVHFQVGHTYKSYVNRSTMVTEWIDLTPDTIPIWHEIKHACTALDFNNSTMFFLDDHYQSNYDPQQYYKPGYKFKELVNPLRYYYTVSGEYYTFFFTTNKAFAEGDTVYIEASDGMHNIYTIDTLIRANDSLYPDCLVPASMEGNSDAYLTIGDTPSSVDPVITSAYVSDWVPLYDLSNKQDKALFALTEIPMASEYYGEGPIIAKYSNTSKFIVGHFYVPKSKIVPHLYAYSQGKYFTTEDTTEPTYIYARNSSGQITQVSGYKRGSTIYRNNGSQIGATRYPAGDLTDEYVDEFTDITPIETQYDIMSTNAVSGLAVADALKNNLPVRGKVKPALAKYSWVSKDWGDQVLEGLDIWTDGTTVYFSSGMGSKRHMKLNRTTGLWEDKYWSGIGSYLYGRDVWTNGTSIYFSDGDTQRVLGSDAWNTVSWSGFTSFNGRHVWTDGVDYYYSEGTNQYKLTGNLTWSAKTWTGLTDFDGENVWSDGLHVYYSDGTNQYVLDRANDTWVSKTWSGGASIVGKNVWTDGVSYFYSNGTNQYVLDLIKDTWEPVIWQGETDFDGENIWSDGTRVYYSTTTVQAELKKFSLVARAKPFVK